MAATKKTTPRRSAKRTAARRRAAPAPDSPRFAVVGTGRCGTGYVATVLRASGVPCGHEGWWRPEGTGERTPGLDGDASWLALPDIETGAWRGPVAHIVRHPVATVRSLLGTRLFHPDSEAPAYRAFALRALPEVEGLDPLTAAVEWWVRWNERCARHATVALRVEDLRHDWALAELGDALGVAVDVERAHAVPNTINSRPRSRVDEALVWELLAGRGEQFGYRP